MGTVLSVRISGWMMVEAERLGLRKTNYEGKPVTGSLGLALAGSAFPVYLAAAILQQSNARVFLSFALVGTAAAGLGFLDDRWGSRSVGGFRGHFGALARGRFTTGAAKALFFPPVALVAARGLLGQSWGCALLTMALVSLSANTVNLLDVRPGRATRAWLVCAGFALTVMALSGTIGWPLVLILGPTLAYLPLDVGRRGMLGDAGSNFLGALLGLQMAVGAPLVWRVGLASVLIYTQWYTERRSLSEIIEGSRWLAWLDSGRRESQA